MSREQRHQPQPDEAEEPMNCVGRCFSEIEQARQSGLTIFTVVGQWKRVHRHESRAQCLVRLLAIRNPTVRDRRQIRELFRQLKHQELDVDEIIRAILARDSFAPLELPLSQRLEEVSPPAHPHRTSDALRLYDMIVSRADQN